jgi:Tol biopolymer transport system component
MRWSRPSPIGPSCPRKLPSNCLRRCLTKDRKQRLQAIGEARIALENPPGPATAPQSAAAPPRPNRIWPAVAAGFFLGLAALVPVAWTHFREKPEDRPLQRLDVDLGPDVALPLPVLQASDIAISPDGTRIVYTSGTTGQGQVLYIRKLDQAKAAELTKGMDPVFSPDGQWIAFEDSTSGQLSKISVDGGAVVRVTAVNATGFGVGWGEGAGFIMPQRGKGLARIGSAGGNPQALTELSQGEALHSYPKVLPGDKAVLFVSQAGGADDDSKTIEAVTLAGHRRKVPVRGGTSPRYLPTGHLIYTNKSTLFAVPFDLDKLEVRGVAVPLVSDIAASTNGVGQFDVSATGTLIYRKAGGAAVMNSTIQWIDPSGKRQPLVAKPGQYADLRFSPDGRRLALQIAEGGQTDIWVYDIQRDAMTRLTSGASALAPPQWSPDGRWIAFSSFAGGLSFTRSDGAIQPQPLLPGTVRQVPDSFSPDGKRLAYTEIAGAPQIWTVPLEEQGGQLKAGQPEQFLRSTSIEVAARFSPDGRWLAYFSSESGTKYEIYVRPFPPPASGLGGKWQISNNGATGAPWWAHNGRELYYAQGDQLMAVATPQRATHLWRKSRACGSPSWAGRSSM